MRAKPYGSCTAVILYCGGDGSVVFGGTVSPMRMNPLFTSIHNQTVVHGAGGTSRTIDLREQRILASTNKVPELRIDGA